MQKDATKAAAEMAGIGNVALMQEPVAAVMSVIKSTKVEGLFLVFDLGEGGTLDIALAENIGGKINFYSHMEENKFVGEEISGSINSLTKVTAWLQQNFAPK